MKTAEEILAEKGIQFPASRSPRDYNLTIIAMKEYVQFDKRINDLQGELDAAKSNATFWEGQHKDLAAKYKALTTYVNERKKA